MEPPPGPRPVPPPRRTASGEHRAASPPGGEPRACWERAPERARGPHRESAVTQTVLIVLEKRGEMAPTQAAAQLETSATQAAAQLETTPSPATETASGTAPTQAAAQLGTTRRPSIETASGTAPTQAAAQLEMAPTQAAAQLETSATQAAAQLETTRRPSIETASGTAPTQAAAQLGTTRSPATETATGTAMETATGTAMETATETAMETATETAMETATETAPAQAMAQLGTTRSPATETATEMAPTQAMAQLGTTQSPAMETATEKQAMAQLGTTQSSATETTMVQLDRTPTQAMARHRKMQIPATETTSETATAKYEITPTQAMEQSPPMETVKLKMTPVQAMVQHGSTQCPASAHHEITPTQATAQRVIMQSPATAQNRTTQSPATAHHEITPTQATAQRVMQSPATAQNRTTQRHVTVQHETTTAHATVQHRTMLSPVTAHQETIPSHTMAQLQTVQSHATGQQKPMLSPATVQLETTQSPATTPHKAMLSNVTPQYETAKSHTMEYDITPEQSRATHTMPQHEMMQACKTPERHDTSHHDMAQSHTTLHNTAQLEMLQNHAIQHLLTVQHETAQSHITPQSEIQQYKTDSYDTMQSHKLTQNCVLPQQDDRELSRMAPLQSSNQQESSTLIQHGSAMQGTTVQSSATLQDKHVLQSHGKPDSDGIVQSNVTLKLDSKITQQGYNVSPSPETLQSHQSPQQSNTLMDTESHTPSYVQSQEDNSTTCVVSLARDRIKQRNVLKSNLSTSNTPPADGCVSVASGDLLQKDVTAAQDKVLTNVKGATHGELIPSSPSKTSHGFSEQTLVTKEEPRCTSGMLPHSFPQVAPAYAGQAPSHSSSELSTLTTGEAQSSSTSEVNPVSLKETPSHTYLVEASVSTSGSPSHSNPGAAPLSTGGIPARSSPGAASLSSTGGSKLSPVRVHDPSSPLRNKSSKPPLPTPPRSNLYPGPPPSIDSDSSFRHETASLASYRSKPQAPDTLSYLDSVSLMSGTMESLSMLDDASSLGSDSEINGMTCRKTDKYGFLGGNQYSGNGESNIPVEIARQRELKWLDMFNHWDKWLSRRFQKVKLRCRKGIPSSLRSKAWQLLSNSHDLLLKNPGKFEEMERQPGDPKWLDVIEKDLHRQFPFHEMFAARGGHGQQDLFRILKAYTIYRPEEGYCQAQAPVAAVLLMHMPAEQAFWCLVQICDKYLPGYYSAGLEAIQLDGEIFFALLRRTCPMAYRHLKKFKIDPILYMTEWFMCIFSRTLPWASVLRVWDMFFCEGVKIVFRIGLVLLKHTLGSVDKLRSCQGMYETMEKLRSLPTHCMHEDILLPEVSSLPVTDALIERESNTQLRKWRENRGELQYRPSRRMHGARHLHEEKVRLNPALSGSRLSLSSLMRPSPPSTPTLVTHPGSVVVSEGLRPALPSPTSNKAPLGPPKAENKKVKEKQREEDKRREKEEREKRERDKKREKEERERERKREKEREKEEKRALKEREKTDAKLKKERKFSFRRKEQSSPASDLPQKSGKGSADGEEGAVHDTYF